MDWGVGVSASGHLKFVPFPVSLGSLQKVVHLLLPNGPVAQGIWVRGLFSCSTDSIVVPRSLSMLKLLLQLSLGLVLEQAFPSVRSRLQRHLVEEDGAGLLRTYPSRAISHATKTLCDWKLLPCSHSARGTENQNCSQHNTSSKKSVDICVPVAWQ
eukprot:4257969-Amphidinium_carterae.3